LGVRATLTSKGQVTVPQEVREGLHLSPGEKIEFELLPDGSYRVHRTSLDLGNLVGRLSAFAAPKPVGPNDIEAARATEYEMRSKR
jgi:antitoxin PrlF